ncbi:MAG TPA: LysR family transcriptional regulator, partial [Solirubrobacteraceae bacterium]
MNLGGLDLNLLVALDALLSERSVTRAAQRVGLSQPGMSNALGRLRRLLDDPLLVRQGSTLVPTARAEALIGPVQEALEIIRRALDVPAGFDPATDRRSFRLSCSDYSVLMVIGPLVRALAAEAPGVLVEVLPRLADAGRALLNGDVDLVIEPPEIMGDTDLESLRLWDDRWECCVWEGNTRVGKRMTM